MALSVFAGSFNKNAGTGAQAVTGVGFTPKILLMWTAYKSSAAAVSYDYSYSWGMTTGAAESYSCSVSSAGNVGVSNRSKRGAAKALTVVQYGETLLAECDLTSFDADGFTLDWTTNGGGTQIIHFLALGGTDITGQKVLTLTSPTIAGNKAYTGVGFEPGGLILARPVLSSALPVSAAGLDLALSLIDAAGNTAALNVLGDDGLANPDHATRRVLQSKATVLTNSGGAERESSTFVSVDSDGFTLSYATPNAADLFGCLAFKGPRVKVGYTTLNPASVTGVGWTPTAVLLAGVQDTLGTHRGDLRLAVGASTGATAALNQSAAVIDDRSTSTGGNTNASGVDVTDQTLVLLQSTPLSIGLDLRLVSFDADGFTMDTFDVNYWGYMALSAAPSSIGDFVDAGEEG